jgi:hypothetical protein
VNKATLWASGERGDAVEPKLRDNSNKEKDRMKVVMCLTHQVGSSCIGVGL